MTSKDYKNAQALVWRAPAGNAVHHCLLSFGSAQAGKEFIRTLLEDEILSFGCSPISETACVSIGLSFVGLRALQIPEPFLSVFRRLSPPFCEGAHVRASEHLGDVGQSAPACWHESCKKPDKLHGFLSVHGDSTLIKSAVVNISGITDRINGDIRDGIDAYINCDWLPQNEAKPLAIQHCFDGRHLEPPPEAQQQNSDLKAQRWVHFGYRDGLTNPHICDKHGAAGNRDCHRAGELLLGHLRDAGDNPWALANTPEVMRSFFRNGSFGIFRDVEQDTVRFEESVRQWALQLLGLRGENSDDQDEYSKHRLEKAKMFVKAKLCGRWPTGEVIRPTDTIETGPTGTRGPPDYSDDLQGIGCPFASHIRRMNPRDFDRNRLLARPLFRRGVPYSSKPGTNNSSASDKTGLLGHFFCSDIAAQFEHLLGQWADQLPLGFSGDPRCKDPLIGAHDNPEAVFGISGAYEQPEVHRTSDTERVELKGFTPFVKTRFTIYCFYPSKLSLMQILEPDGEGNGGENG